MPNMQWSKITLVGVGLLGGSLGMAIRQRGLAGRVTGYARRMATVKESLLVGAVDDATTDLIVAVKDARLIVFCTPVEHMRSLAQQMLAVLTPGALVTDVGSVKQEVVEALEPLFRSAGCDFVGSHPMAGAEKTGVSAARADLFEKAVCVVTPTANTPADAVNQVTGLWTAVGGKPMTLPVDLHDELVSRSSHLVHVTAAALARFVLDPTHPKEQAQLCATGFRDTTRVASGSPEMWREILMSNRENIRRALRSLNRELTSLEAALERADLDYINDFLSQAKRQRDAWCSQNLSPE
jgi:prephenate dehydrogenase